MLSMQYLHFFIYKSSREWVEFVNKTDGWCGALLVLMLYSLLNRQQAEQTATRLDLPEQSTQKTILSPQNLNMRK